MSIGNFKILTPENDILLNGLDYPDIQFLDYEVAVNSAAKFQSNLANNLEGQRYVFGKGCFTFVRMRLLKLDAETLNTIKPYKEVVFQDGVDLVNYPCTMSIKAEPLSNLLTGKYDAEISLSTASNGIVHRGEFIDKAISLGGNDLLVDNDNNIIVYD